MNILNRLTLKHLKLNKKRTIVSIVGIMLSTAMMVAIGLLVSTVREVLIDETIYSSGAQTMIIENVPYNKIDIIKNNDLIEDYYIESHYGVASYSGSSNGDKPFFYITEVNKKLFTELVLKSGKIPTNNTEILIPEHVYDQGEFPYSIGDEITLEIGSRYLNNELINYSKPYDQNEKLVSKETKTYKIVGIIKRSKYESYSSPGFILYTLGDNFFSNVNVYLIANKTNDIYNLGESIYKNLGLPADETTMLNAIHYNNNLLALSGHSKYENIMNFMVGFIVIFLSIIAVACIIVIYNSFAISVMERKKQFGLYSSIGATKKQIRKTVLFEAGIVGLIGIFLGIICAYIGIGITLMIIDNLLKGIFVATTSFTLTTYPLFVVIPIIFIIITIFISAYLPAKRASKISPVEVIRQNDDIKIGKRKIKTNKYLDKLFGIEYKIASKNIKRNKKKYRVTIASLFISIVTFLAFSAYLTYTVEGFNDYILGYDFDIMIQNAHDISDTDKNKLREIIKHPEVKDYLQYKNYYYYIEPILKNNFTKDYKKDKNLEDLKVEGLNVIILTNHDFENYKKEIGLKENKVVMYNDYRGLDYSNNSRKIKSIEIFNNSDFKLAICDYNIIEDGHDSYNECHGKLENFYLTKKLPKYIVLENGSYTVIMNEDMYGSLEKLDYKLSVTEYSLIVANNYTELDKLGDELSQDVVYFNITNELKMQSNLVLVLKILFYGLIALVTAIGVTSVFNTINTSINLRRREFSVLRSIGMDPKSFNKMLWYESFMFGFKSLLYGVPIGILLSYLISLNMNQLVESGFRILYMPILIVVLAVFIIIISTMYYSTSKIKKENILDSIKNENI